VLTIIGLTIEIVTLIEQAIRRIAVSSTIEE